MSTVGERHGRGLAALAYEIKRYKTLFCGPLQIFPAIEYLPVPTAKSTHKQENDHASLISAISWDFSVIPTAQKHWKTQPHR